MVILESRRATEKMGAVTRGADASQARRLGPALRQSRPFTRLQEKETTAIRTASQCNMKLNHLESSLLRIVSRPQIPIHANIHIRRVAILSVSMIRPSERRLSTPSQRHRSESICQVTWTFTAGEHPPSPSGRSLSQKKTQSNKHQS